MPAASAITTSKVLVKSRGSDSFPQLLQQQSIVLFVVDNFKFNKFDLWITPLEYSTAKPIEIANRKGLFWQNF
jgi:hypothetical protein